MDRKTIKTVIVTVLALLALFGVWQGVRAIKRQAAPGQAAAAYIDALIRLGKMPTGDQVRQAIQQAQAPAIQGEYVDKVPEGGEIVKPGAPKK